MATFTMNEHPFGGTNISFSQDPKKHGPSETEASSQTPKKDTSPILIIFPEMEDKLGEKASSGPWL